MSDEFNPEDYVASLHPDAVKLHRAQEDLKSEKKKNEQLVKQLAEMEERLHRSMAIKDPKRPARLKTKKKRGLRQVTPVFMASDWHLEEEIKPERVNHRNEYNLGIAERRAANFFDGVAWQSKFYKRPGHEDRAYSLDKAVLWLGGDLISNYLHEELEESNLLSPLEAIRFAQRIIMQGIDHLLEECDFDELLVVCNHGNHGRMTKKKRAKTSAVNNLEWLMYHSLAEVYAKADSRVRFQIAEGSHEYVEVEGHWIRFTHGDDWRYEGGVGGLSVPVLRGIQRLDKGAPHPVELTVLGHFHTLQDFGSAFVNGSLIGYSEYALSKSFPFERPQQGFFLVDSERGKFASHDIWVTESDR